MDGRLRVASRLNSTGSLLKLYRDILRAHRKYLPPVHRDLGDTYVKAEVSIQLHLTWTKP